MSILELRFNEAAPKRGRKESSLLSDSGICRIASMRPPPNGGGRHLRVVQPKSNVWRFNEAAPKRGRKVLIGELSRDIEL